MKIGYKKFVSLFVTGSMLLTTVLIPAYADNVKVKSSDSSNQMASEEEFVYLNAYDADTRTQDFDQNWKFYLGDVENAQDPAFNDSAWKSISLPHDYSITQDYTQSGEAESGYLPGGTGWYRKSFSIPNAKGKRVRIDFDGAYMNAVVWINGHKLGTHPYGYSPFSFDITDYLKYDQDNIIAVRTENKIPSSRWYSGSGLYRDVELTITDPVHVDLNGTKIETPNLEDEIGGGAVTVSVKTTLRNDGDTSANVTLKQSVIPKSSPDLANAIGTAEQGDISIAPGTAKDISDTIQADHPNLWTLDDPNLYLLRTQVIRDGQVIDTYDTEFGFRYFKFDPNTGFSLNGTKMKLKGVAMHHDQGSLGSAAYHRAMERQVEILKQMGCNAIRVTHNPADKELMEICNEKGMLVVEEAYDTWLYPKNGNVNDFSKWFNVPIEDGNTIEGGTPGMLWSEFDLKAFMKRDQNDPSLIMYSLGNEVMEGISGDTSRIPPTAQQLITWAREVDTTRPVTIGDNKLKDGNTQSTQMGAELAAVGGEVGLNYASGDQLDARHREHPDWNLYGSETASAINSRGVYKNNLNHSPVYELTSYDESTVGWGKVASDAWYTVLTRDYMAGEFVWTGFDYIGEPTPWNGTGPGAVEDWPSPKSSYFGIVDTAGFPKDSYYLYQSLWNDEVHTLHILPAWNSNVVSKDSDNKVKVVVYTDAPSAELFFTPKGSDTPRSLGRKTFTQKQTADGYTYQIYEGADQSYKEDENLYLSWMVPYEDGTLTAKAYTTADGNTEMTDTQGRSTVTTTGAPAKLSASVDRDSIVADGKDLAYVTVDVTDENGNLIPDASNRIKFTVEGDGELIGVDNGNEADHDSYQADSRKAFSGKALAIVRSTGAAGSFTLTASAPGLRSSSVTVTTTQAPKKPGSEGGITGYSISKHYYVKTGTMPELPTAVTVHNADGTDGRQNVTWSSIPEEEIQTNGSFIVRGTLENGIPVSVTVNMIEGIAALLNYSCAVQTGGAPALPASRPAVMMDGEVINVQFPVTWEDVDSSSFDSPGMVHVNGTSQVFGKDLQVSADIRVSNEEISVGSNVAPNAMTLKEDTPQAQKSDTLTAVIDGSTAYHPVSEDETNVSCWTNRKYAQAGGTKSELTFAYATAERLKQSVIYFVDDGSQAQPPSQAEFYYSLGGTSDHDWINIPAAVQPGTETDQVIPYTYTFNSPVNAVLLKIVVTNAGETAGMGTKPYTGITEIQLNRAVGSFTQYLTLSWPV